MHSSLLYWKLLSMRIEAIKFDGVVAEEVV